MTFEHEVHPGGVPPPDLQPVERPERDVDGPQHAECSGARSPPLPNRPLPNRPGRAVPSKAERTSEFRDALRRFEAVTAQSPNRVARLHQGGRYFSLELCGLSSDATGFESRFEAGQDTVDPRRPVFNGLDGDRVTERRAGERSGTPLQREASRALQGFSGRSWSPGLCARWHVPARQPPGRPGHA